VLIKALNDADGTIRQAAVEILGELRIAPLESVPALAALLNDDDQGIRFWAVTSLARYGPQAESALAHLIAALRDDHPGVRMRAADAIGEIGPAAKDALPDLERLRNDRDFFIYPHTAAEYVGPHARFESQRVRKGSDWREDGRVGVHAAADACARDSAISCEQGQT
jgi:HEAT repeat protein